MNNDEKDILEELRELWQQESDRIDEIARQHPLSPDAFDPRPRYRWRLRQGLLRAALGGTVAVALLFFVGFGPKGYAMNSHAHPETVLVDINDSITHINN